MGSVHRPAVIELFRGKGVPLLLMHPLLPCVEYKGCCITGVDNLQEMILLQ